MLYYRRSNLLVFKFVSVSARKQLICTLVVIVKAKRGLICCFKTSFAMKILKKRFKFTRFLGIEIYKNIT